MIRGFSVFQWAQRREGVWPRAYPVRPGQRLFLGGVGVANLAGGIAGSLAMLAHNTFGSSAWAVLPLLFSALGVYLLAAVHAGRILLYEDAIEFLELGKRKRRLRRDEISGLRWIAMPYSQMQLVLELRGGERPFKLTWLHETDPVLDAWFASIPNLDMEDHARAEAELLQSVAIGASEPDRVRALARARKIARILAAMSTAACGWGLFYPHPYPTVVATLGAIPLVGVGLLLAKRGLYAFDTQRNDPRPSLITTMGPGLVLGLRAVLDLQVLDWEPLLAGALTGGLAITAAVAVGDPKMRKVWLLAISAPILGIYPWGGLALANALLDPGASEVLRVAVRGKHVSSGRYTSYDLTLDPWGPVTEARGVAVARALYETTPVGEHVCVRLNPGALGARWYIVQRCVDEMR